ncbi:hypothetical protein PGB90_009326 [Kerria lacca]
MNGLLLLLIFICSVQCVSDLSNLPHINQEESNIYEDICQNEERNCSDLSQLCLICPEYNKSMNCRYGKWLNTTCSVRDNVKCWGNRSNIIKKARCVYCYQTERWEHSCVLKNMCTAIQSPLAYYKTNCTVHHNVMCFGKRNFNKKLRCNWTRGHKWSTALLLSITLGGFGADRFYLGHWQEGIGKLFSFGGLGVWTLVDVLLIAIRYLGPADGTFYV